MVVAPAILFGYTAEQQVDHGADGEQVVAHQEILQVHNAHAQGLHAAPQVVAQQTGQDVYK